MDFFGGKFFVSSIKLKRIWVLWMLLVEHIEAFGSSQRENISFPNNEGEFQMDIMSS